MPGACGHTVPGLTMATDAGAAMRRFLMHGASLHNLHQLVVMRNVAIVGQTAALVVAERGLNLRLPVLPMAAVIGALAVFNLATWRSLRLDREVRDRELALQLLVDIAALTLLLGMTGGAGNPFVGMFLLPLAITAASLPWRYTWFVALVTVACHTLLVFEYRPLFPPGEEARHVRMLVAGLWVNYTITAGMVAFFLVRIAMGLRASERALAATHEREIRNEHVVRIGTLAAGAAHELAQPMATLSLLMSELQESCSERPEQRDLLQQATQQLGHCREALGSLLSYGRSNFDSRTEVQAVDELLRESVGMFRARRPGVPASLNIDTPGAAPRIRHDLALRQAILNLLNNAADVSPQWVDVRVRWDEEHVTVSVHDRGPGITPEVARQLGRMFFTTKPAGAGNGLGLNLAYTAVARLGGALQLGNAPEGGACAKIVLPVEEPGRTESPAAPGPGPA